MAEETPGTDAAVLGLNDQARRAAEQQSLAGLPTATREGVNTRARPRATHGGKLLPIMVGLLLVISVVNLILVLIDRSRFSAALTKQNNELVVLAHRMDSSDKAYAQLRGQVAVTSEKVGLTPEELSRAQSLAAGVQKQQQAAVQQLYQAIRQRALNDPSIYPIF
jgi:hypothetical protein